MYYMRACAHTYTHTHMHIHTCTHAHMHICTYVHMYIRTYAHTHICAHYDTHMHTSHMDRQLNILVIVFLPTHIVLKGPLSYHQEVLLACDILAIHDEALDLDDGWWIHPA
jgi:hypothetical protein